MNTAFLFHFSKVKILIILKRRENPQYLRQVSSLCKVKSRIGQFLILKNEHDHSLDNIYSQLVWYDISLNLIELSLLVILPINVVVV
jgi:hypothetical protein